MICVTIIKNKQINDRLIIHTNNTKGNHQLLYSVENTASLTEYTSRLESHINKNLKHEQLKTI